MCGIAGIRDLPAGRDLAACVERMSLSLRHRGPDAGEQWTDASVGIALGHRRLSIVDLTETGRQPMASASGRYVVSYNGELYNTEELRRELAAAGVAFRGRSDTEVLLEAVARWGMLATLKKLIGIFAFAVWDRETRTLSLARDHLGVKPLFWSRGPRLFLFASELRALATLPEFDRAIDPQAVGSYFQYNYIRSPFTIYKQARALEPGHLLTLAADGTASIEQYWSLAGVVASQAPARARERDTIEVVELLGARIEDGVRRQLVSDVPIGALLSGGIDSSTVVALMQKISAEPVRTFSIGFDVPELDEAQAARSVAKHLGTDHTEHYVTAADAIDLVPSLAHIYDQPLADPSTVPTYLLCRLTRRQVTVALSGDGGDELFYGYDRYLKAARMRYMLGRLPGPARRAADRVLDPLGGRWLRENGFGISGRAVRAGWHTARLLHLASGDVDDAYLHFITHRIEGAVDGRDIGRWLEAKRATADPDEQMMLMDATTYLPDAVLAKVDRASMASSLEVRVPLLDHRLVELAWSLPQSVKQRDGTGKWCLRQVLYRHVPRALVDRPKAGFGAPIGPWLRGSLRDWAEHLLSGPGLAHSGLVDAAVARRLWQAHLDGKVDASIHLWPILMLQAWLEETRRPSGEARLAAMLPAGAP